MEEKKQRMIAHQDIFNIDGTLAFMLIVEYEENKGAVEHVYKANYPNKFFTVDPFLYRFQIVFN